MIRSRSRASSALHATFASRLQLNVTQFTDMLSNPISSSIISNKTRTPVKIGMVETRESARSFETDCLCPGLTTAREVLLLKLANDARLRGVKGD